MNRKRSFIAARLGVLIALPLFTVAGTAFAQELQIEGGIIGAPEVLFLTNFNLLNSGSDAPVFSVTISTTTNTPVQVKLNFTLFSQKYGENIVEAETLPFMLIPGQPRTITNIDITNSSVDQDIRLSFFNYNTELATSLQESILRTSKLPNDRYTLTVRLINFNTPSDFAKIEEVIDVTNPTTIDLIGPGMLVNNSSPCQDIFTTFPLFSWTSNADKFVLRICQVLDENASPEDVMQNEPRALLTLKRDEDFFGSPSIVYPSTGVWPLVEGQTYYWQVQAVAASPSGEVLLPSEIWCFRVARLDDATRRLMSSSILNALRTLLAGTPYENILNENGPLGGFSPTGTIRLNGRTLDLFELNALIPQAAAGTIKIQEVKIE